MNHFTRWMVFGTLGILLVGAGLCFAIESAFLKHSDPDSMTWFWAGTGSLVIFNAGITMVGNATYNRVLHTLEKRKK